MYNFLPETKGKSLEEVEDYFTRLARGISMKRGSGSGSSRHHVYDVEMKGHQRGSTPTSDVSSEEGKAYDERA